MENTQKFNITGMGCAACSAKIEKAVSGMEQITSCSVNLLTNSMTTTGPALAEEIIKTVQNAGYGASLAQNNISENDFSSNSESKAILKRLIYSAGFLLVLMYFSMGQMFGLPLPRFLSSSVTIGLVQLVFSLTILIINKKFFITGFKGFVHFAPNMDTLVCLGSGISFLWSLFLLILMIFGKSFGGHKISTHDLYFESAAMILVLISVGKLLESVSKGKTTSALKSLMKLSPQTATILQNEKEVLVAVENVKIDDIFVVKPGELVPVDGIVIEGSSTVDESALTGESIPVEKEIGCNVSSGTLNQSGFLKCKATKVGKDTTINKIIQLVSDASSSKAPIAKIADKVSGIFVPSVIFVSIITFVVWLILGHSIDFALTRAISVLVISCPCALGLATPVAIMVGSGKGAKNGILFKTAQSLETAGKINTVVFDKTGTITNGTPVVTDFVLSSNFTENQLLQIALDLEIKSEHPLAKAIVKKAEEKNLVAKNIENFMSFGGKGISGSFENSEFFAGKWDFVSTKIVKKINPEVSEIHNKCEKLAAKGKTPLYFVKDGNLIGAILVADTIKNDSKKAISVLKQMNINVVMLTGDNPITAKEIASQVGIENVVANILPEEKAREITKLSEKTQNANVAMVGDGINDAPALATAYCGIAVGAGTDVAIDAADIVLMKNTLLDVPAAITLSKKTLRNIKQNLFWAFIYNIICIPLAAGCLFLPFGIILNPMIGAAAMSLSSFCVVTNSLRLNFAKIY